MLRTITLCSLFLLPSLASAGVDDWLKTQVRDKGSKALDPATAAAGLKEALEVGTQKAVGALGRENGYFGNAQVKIPIPEKLTRVEKTLVKVGKEKTAQEFVLSLNRAAEAAVPEATAVFVTVIKAMTIADAISIVKGPDDAATRYFRTHSEGMLKQKFQPIVSDATNRVGVTQRYKKLLKEAGSVAVLLDLNNLDIDEYITAKALDGLFHVLAGEEKRIRDDPVARTTELLRAVFGK